MRTLGILGGMSWESTALYYRLLNEGVREELGGLHSADLLVRSFHFAAIEAMQAKGDWDGAGAVLADAAVRLEGAGARAIVIATNTMHLLVPAIEAQTGVPVPHIADATLERLREAGVRRPLLLATRYTMERELYRGRLASHGISAFVPDDAGRATVPDVIYDELCRGIVRDESREAYKRVVAEGIERGADGVIFNCTEVGMLLSAEDMPVPSFDTTAIHCQAAVTFMLGDEPRAE